MDRRQFRTRASLAKQLIEVHPVVPSALVRLMELSNNLFFSWHRPTRALFEDLDPELWQQASGNPRLVLRCVDQENLDRAAVDPAYLERYRQVLATFDAYLSAPRPRQDEPLVAYFCAEYGFHESFPIYSEVWESWRAITARLRATSGSISLPWACSIPRATSSSR